MEINTLHDQVAKQYETMNAIHINFNDETKIEESSQIILNYLKETKTDCIASLSFNDELNTIHQFLIYSDEFVVNKKYLDFKNPINFLDYSDKQYYATNLDDNNSQGYLKSLNQSFFDKRNYEVEYSNFYQFGEKIKNNGNMIALYIYDNINFIVDLQEKLSVNKVVMEDITAGYAGARLSPVDNVLVNQMLPLLFMASVSFLAGVCFIIAKQQKEILVLKSLGYCKFKIIYTCFASFLISSICMMLLTCMIMFYALANNINKLTEEFFLFILGFSAIFIFFIFIVVLAMWLYIKYVIRLDALLCHKNLKFIIIGNTIVKIVVTILMISPFIASASNTFPTLMGYLSIKMNEDKIKEYTKVNMIPSDVTDIFNEYIDEIVYLDFEYYYSNTEAMLRQDYGYMPEIIDEIVETSALDYPIVYANKCYLKDIPLYQQDGQKLNLQKIDEDVILIPETAKNIDLKKYNPDNNKIIYIKNTGSYVNYACQEPYKLNNPVIHLVTKYGNNMNFTSVYMELSKAQTINQEINEK